MKKIISIFALAALATTPALANSGHNDMAPGWTNHFVDKADTNKDGFIDKDEFMAFQEKKFTEMDKDNDGQLTKAEVMAHKKEEMSAMKSRHHSMRSDSSNSPNKPDNTNAGKDRSDTSEDAKTNTEGSNGH